MSTPETAKRPLSAGYRGIEFCDGCGARLDSGEWLSGLCGACFRPTARRRSTQTKRPRGAHSRKPR